MLKILLMLSSTLLIISCNVYTSNNKTQSIKADVVGVYIKKGDTQCNDDGLTLAEATRYLTDEDIDVAKSNCGVFTGVSVISMCGAGTNNIYYFSINKTALAQAEGLGFISVSSLGSELGYEAAKCQ